MKIKLYFTFKYCLSLLILFLFFCNYSYSQIYKNKKKAVYEPLQIMYIGTEIKIDTIKKIVFSNKIDTITQLCEFTKYSDNIDMIKTFSFISRVKRNITKGDFKIFENNEPILSFNELMGTSFSFGFGYEFYLLSDFSFETKVLYDKYFLSASTNCLLPIINNKYAITEHIAELNLDYFTISLCLKYDVFNDIKIIAGYSREFLNRSFYNHIVKLKSDEIIYENNAKEKRFNNKHLKNVKNGSTLTTGIVYRIPFIISNFGLDINPVFLYRVNEIINSGNLKLHSIILNINFIYMF